MMSIRRQKRWHQISSAKFILAASILLMMSATSAAQPETEIEPIKLIPGLTESEVWSLDEIDEWNPDTAVIQKLLNRMPAIDPEQFAQFKSHGFKAFNERVDSESPLKIQLFDLTGIVVDVQKHKISERVRDRFDFSTFYFVDISNPATKSTMRVCARSVPSVWLTTDPRGQKVGFQGLYVYTYREGDRDPQVVSVFVAPRVEWFPAGDQIRINSGQKILAKQKVDIGRFDLVAETSGLALGKKDSETFFQMLSATQNLERSELPVADKIDIADLFRNTSSHYGRLLKIRGRLRRITEVEVNSAPYGDRFGVNKYYQLDMFIPIEGRIRVVDANNKALTFQNNFPVSVCVTKLPESLQGMKNVSEDVELVGFFFKMWSYQSEKSRREGVVAQTSPLFIGIQPELYSPPRTRDFDWLVFGILTLGGLAILISIVFLWSARRNRRSVVSEPMASGELEKIDIE